MNTGETFQKEERDKSHFIAFALLESLNPPKLFQGSWLSSPPALTSSTSPFRQFSLPSQNLFTFFSFYQ